MPSCLRRATGMCDLLWFVLLLLPMTCLGATVQAASDVEALPPPRGVGPESAQPAEVLVLPGYYRTSRYDVWQFYGVDRRGGFRPRVVYSPSGPYVLYNGAPYPFAPMHNLDFMPYVVD